MGQSHSVTRGFNPEILTIAIRAYDKSIAALGNPDPIVREVVAKQIIRLLSEGESSPDALSERALGSAGIPPDTLGQLSNGPSTDHGDPA